MSQDPLTLHDAAKVAFRQYWTSGQLAYLNQAVECWYEALQLIPSNSPSWPALQNNLGIGLRDRYRHTGDLSDLEKAIDAFQQAVQATPDDSPDRPARLSNLAIGLRDRYVRTWNLDDLEAAITASQQAIQASPSNSPNRSRWQSNLGMVVYDRYTRTGDLSDLEKAIDAFQQAVRASSSDSSDWPTQMMNLGAGLHERFTHTGDLHDLEKAIDAFQQAVQTTPPSSPDRPARQNNLAIGLRDRYTHTGDLHDLEKAIDAFQQAVQTTPPSSPDRSRWLSNLGAGLRTRYIRTGDLHDLEKAIDAFQQAVQASSNASDRPTLLNNLGNGLSERYRRSGDLSDLEKAIDAFQQAVQTTPSNSPDWSRWQNNLAVGLHDRYSHTGGLNDLEAAIAASQQAILATRSNSPDRPARQNNLAVGLYDRYTHTGDLNDLEAAINVFQQIGQPIPFDSPDRSAWLSNLGLGLYQRYMHTRNLNDLDDAIMAWEKSWSLPHPLFAALPVTYQLGQQRQVAGVAAHLITAYIERGKQLHPRSYSVPRRILEIAEGSKSRLLTQLVGRGPLPKPSRLPPETAAREQQLLAKLTELDTWELVIHNHQSSTQDEASHLQRLQQRQAALSELEDLWTQITHIGPEGAEYVALRRGTALTWQDFTGLTKALGPTTALCSFFTTADRALLFLLRAGWRTPRVFEEPLNQTGWTALLGRFFREVHRVNVQANQTNWRDFAERTLRVYHDGPNLHRRETWDQSLCQLLAKAQPYLKGVERLIFAPAGNGHLLPWGVLVERAGWHRSSGQPISLVTLPALSVLPRLRRHRHVPPGLTLVVGNPRGDLPHAEAETHMVAKQFGTNPLLGTAATKSEVLARFANATLIHLATHAFFDVNNPLESGIVLADGVLTAREILQHRLQANLLVLSACESGRVGSLGGEELAGLSQAFLQAGVRSLLVSLWRVSDPATAALMQAFYSAWQGETDKAQALRQAMTRIQQDPSWSDIYYWGAFVLMGDWE
ncbi:MAG: CHAT domain-containing protein [Ktedonobacteraceae bacterium]